MRYFINGEEVTKEYAEAQDKINKAINDIDDLKKWLEAMKAARFITIVKGKKQNEYQEF